MGISRPRFLYFLRFNAVDIKQMFHIKICQWQDSNCDLWCRKQPLYQLSHNHCQWIVRANYFAATNWCDFRNGPTQLLLVIFVLVKNTYFHWRFQNDSNSDCQCRRRACWPPPPQPLRTRPTEVSLTMLTFWRRDCKHSSIKIMT